jgi:hypothetical protein
MTRPTRKQTIVARPRRAGFESARVRGKSLFQARAHRQRRLRFAVNLDSLVPGDRGNQRPQRIFPGQRKAPYAHDIRGERAFGIPLINHPMVWDRLNLFLIEHQRVVSGRAARLLSGVMNGKGLTVRRDCAVHVSDFLAC